MFQKIFKHWYNLTLSLLFIALAMMLALGIVRGARASGTSFTVTSTVDAVDSNPGDGVCASAGSVCTLRAAVQEANALVGDDVIILPSGTYTLTISGAGEDSSASGDLDIATTLTIVGTESSSTIIDGGTLDRVIHIPANTAVVTIANVTIRNGK